MTAAPGPSSGAVSHPRRHRRPEMRIVPHRWLRIPLHMRDWRVRTKLATVLVIPSLAFVALATVQTGSLVRQATVLNEFARQVAVGEQITALIHELQQERDRTAGELAERQTAPHRYNVAGGTAALQAHYEAVDRAVAEFRSAAGPLTRGDASWQVAYARVIESLEGLPGLRSSVEGGAVNANTVYGNYSRAIDALLTLLAEPSPGVERPELTDSVLRYVQLARIKELSSRIRTRIYTAARAGRYGTEDIVELADLRAQQLTAVAEFRVTATDPQVRRYQAATEDPRFQAALTLEETTIGGANTRPPVLNATDWWALTQDRHQLLREVERDVVSDAVAQAQERSLGQLQRTLAVAGIVMIVVLGAVFASVMVGRSIARSLRMLRVQALQVAQFDLPQTLERLRTVQAGIPEIKVPPAAVQSADEVGEVAEAFVAVHRSAVDVALEQAAMRRNVNAMFVNLARRSQVLVERQLELLDELERKENDPEQLEHLFKLDHLAARMRRNDESLLVLAGTESSRRWSQPVGLPTVMLAAIAEIEDYPRVRHEAPEDLYVLGHAVGDLVHLLAELLENATVFSPPYTEVRMTARPEPDRSVTIEIVDDGLGLTEQALAQLNEMLERPPAADVAASERMGLFVVSHLAARQGIRVRLHSSGRGAVAAVSVPASLFTEAPPAESRNGSLEMRPVLASAAPRPLTAARLAASATGVAPVVTVPAPRASVDQIEERDMPVAGRPPAPLTEAVPRQPAPGSRAEEIIASASGGDPGAGSVWWSRPRGGVATVAAPGAPAAPEPVAPQVGPGGLPMRVPMAALPVDTELTSPTPPEPLRYEPDPEAVGTMLSRFYGGVRRAEIEDTTEMTLAPVDRRGEEEQI